MSELVISGVEVRAFIDKQERHYKRLRKIIYWILSLVVLLLYLSFSLLFNFGIHAVIGIFCIAWSIFAVVSLLGASISWAKDR